MNEDENENKMAFFNLLKRLENAFGNKFLFEDVRLHSFLKQLCDLCGLEAAREASHSAGEEDSCAFTEAEYDACDPAWSRAGTVQLFEMPARKLVRRFGELMNRGDILCKCQHIFLYLCTVNLRLKKVVGNDGSVKIQLCMIQFGDWIEKRDGGLSGLSGFWDAEVGSRVLLHEGIGVYGVVCRAATIVVNLADVMDAVVSLRGASMELVHGLVGEEPPSMRLLDYMKLQFESTEEKMDDANAEDFAIAKRNIEVSHDTYIELVHKMLVMFDGGSGPLDGRELMKYDMRVNSGRVCGCSHCEEES